MVHQLHNLEQAIDYLQSLNANAADDAIYFADELASLNICIEGEKYNASINGELARGLWHFQKAIYSAAAYALTGSSDNRKLTIEQRQALELVFEVHEGSSVFKASLRELFQILEKGLVDMESKDKSKTLVAVAVVVAAGCLIGHGMEIFRDIQTKQIKAQENLQSQQNLIRQAEVMAEAMSQSPVAQKFNNAMAEGAKAIARSAPDAQRISFGRFGMDTDDILEINKRAARLPTMAVVLVEDYRIFKVDMREIGVAKYVLAAPGTGEFVATLNEANFSKHELLRIMEAAQERKEIQLEVIIGRRKGAVQSAQITQVF